MELKNNGKINFIVDLFLPLDKYMSGGLIALHKLSHELADLGHNVYIFCEPSYPHKNITVIPAKYEIIKGHNYRYSHKGFSYNNFNTVSIYPEHSPGNKFNTINNVRWVMYHTKKEEEETFNENDYIFNYGNFKTHTNQADGELRILDYNTDIFINKKNENRKGFCFIYGKESPKNYKDLINVFNPTDITKLKDNSNLNLLCKEFNKYEYFLTFDSKTYLTTAASLCGCKSIILKNTDYENLTPIEYKLKNPLNLFGVAYGIEDIKWANDTIDMVRDHIKELEIIDKKTVKQFVSFWEKKLSI